MQVLLESHLSTVNVFTLLICNLQLKVRLVLKEWLFSDGSHSTRNSTLNSRQSIHGLKNLMVRTGRRICINVMEGKDLASKEKSGKCYVKLQYGKVDFHFITLFSVKSVGILIFCCVSFSESSVVINFGRPKLLSYSFFPVISANKDFAFCKSSLESEI